MDKNFSSKRAVFQSQDGAGGEDQASLRPTLASVGSGFLKYFMRDVLITQKPVN